MKGEASKVIKTILTSTAVAGAAVLLPTSGGRAAISKVAARLVPGLKVVGKKAGALVAKKPFASLFVAGLVTTKGGRKLLTEIPKKIFKGGEVLGKVVGGEDTGLTIGGALLTAGLVGGAAVAGKKIFDVVKGRQAAPKAIPSAPSVPTLRDVGAGFLAPQKLGGIPVVPGVPGTGIQAPQQQIRQPPIQNIIQIAVS